MKKEHGSDFQDAPPNDAPVSALVKQAVDEVFIECVLSLRE